MKISIVINTLNRLFSLPNTLEAIAKLRYKDFEVIVVDGPSIDGTEKYLEQFWANKIKIIKCPIANLAISRNVGIAHCAGDVVAFIDDDGLPEPDWLDRLVEGYEGYQNSRVAGVGGFVRDHTGYTYQAKYIRSSRDGQSEIHLGQNPFIDGCTPYAANFIGLIGVNSSFLLSALRGVGGFDEEYSYFLDETDVVVRLVDAGYQIRQIPEAEVHHKYAQSHVRDYRGIPKTLYPIARSTAYFCVKNAIPGTGIKKLFHVISAHENRMRTQIAYLESQQCLSQVEADRLREEVQRGLYEGLKDAYAYPTGRPSKQLDHQTNFLKFVGVLPLNLRKKIAFISPQYPPQICGGVGVFITHLAKYLAHQGHEVTVITPAVGESTTVDYEEGVWVHRIHINFDEDYPWPPSWPDMPSHQKRVAWFVYQELMRIDPRRNFDCVVGTIWDLDLAGVIASRRWPVVMYLVTSYALMLDSKPEWKVSHHFFEAHVKKMMDAELWAMNRVNLVLSSTQQILKDIELAYSGKVMPQKTACVPFGIPPIREMILKKQMSQEVTLLFVGRFEYRKGIDLLLQILPALMNEYEHFHATLVGQTDIGQKNQDGDWSQFQSRYQGESWWPRISCLGEVGDEELMAAYAQADIFIAPSRYESFGLIYLEAMRQALPCIGFNVGGVPEVVIDGETGFLVELENIESLERSVRVLIEDSQLRKNFGNAGFKKFEQMFTLETFANNFMAEIYEVK